MKIVYARFKVLSTGMTENPVLWETTLKVEAQVFSETLVCTYKSVRSHIPVEWNLEISVFHRFNS
jgi:hypothetical protein